MKVKKNIRKINTLMLCKNGLYISSREMEVTEITSKETMVKRRRKGRKRRKMRRTKIRGEEERWRKRRKTIQKT